TQRPDVSHTPCRRRFLEGRLPGLEVGLQPTQRFLAKSRPFRGVKSGAVVLTGAGKGGAAGGDISGYPGLGPLAAGGECRPVTAGRGAGLLVGPAEPRKTEGLGSIGPQLPLQEERNLTVQTRQALGFTHHRGRGVPLSVGGEGFGESPLLLK